ncbi:Osteoclast-stimulating factor 1 [Xenotaenia resolanae]|uniref:Osteoclast-stimulating factor 1 n=1 Tax=Xenotaenia resolanae TaxID=208358 RepID=A0ABV0WBX4_9TELE
MRTSSFPLKITSSLATLASVNHNPASTLPRASHLLSVCLRTSQMSKPPPKPAKPGQVKVFRALFTFDPRTPDELYFEEGDILYISDTSDTNWWKGTCRGRTGLIPSNYVAEQAESIDNPMHEAAKRGNMSWLRECLENKVGINGLDKAGNTALYWGCHGGHKDVVELLLTQPNVELDQQDVPISNPISSNRWVGGGVHPGQVASPS